ncbi:MAG: molybdopterin-dependent oxidoreductase [Anaerolineae bacterium]|nr:molybdopterin-dependent oxidoreductase [Anaerolineae bacterium]
MPTGLVEVTFTLNGREVTVAVEPSRTLLYVLREVLDLTGTKQGCDGEGECGACTILLDGQAVRSCLTPIAKVAGRQVVTVEGLGEPGSLHALQQAFIDHGAVQCGYCTPGMLLSAAALLAREPAPSAAQIVEALAGNLCRCTGYLKIVQAVQAAAAEMRGDLRPGPSDGPDTRPIGGSEVRVDAVDKVTGRARYAEDIKMPGMAYAALVRSPHPHARIVSIDVAPALAMPGVLHVLTAADIPGVNSLEGYSRDESLLNPAGGSVRMLGDAVGLVVADLPQAAQAGAQAVAVEYEVLPHVYDAREALEEGAPAVHAEGNVLGCYEILYGNLGEAMARAEEVIETHYFTPFVEHAAMERESVLSYVEEGPAGERLVVVAGHQEPHWAQGWIARLLALPLDRVRVITPPTGGAFGGKQDPWPLMAGALAAFHTRQPVRLVYSRHESFAASPKRHPYRMDYRVGVTRDGNLTGLQLRIVANTGAYDCDGWYIPQYALVAGGGPYRWQAVDARAWAVYTNGPKAGQMRGFGTPQSTFGRECTLDELAERLGIDPLDLRLQNALADEEETFLGTRPAETLGYRECLAAIRPHYRHALEQAAAGNRAADGPWRRGVGVAGMWYRFGKSGSISCHAQAELCLDGGITLFFAAPDYGQGTTTVMAQIAAETLGVERDSLRLVNADTARTLDSGIQGASRSTYWVGGAVAEAACVLKAQILRTSAEMLDRPPDSLMLDADSVVAPDGSTVPLSRVAAEMERIGLRRRLTAAFAPQVDPYLALGERPEYLPFFVAGAHVAEVEVDVTTGEVRVVRIVAAHDVGRVINRQGVEGQIEGAVLMSLGVALMEEYVPGATRGLADYYLPTFCSMPEIKVIPIEVPSRWGPCGAKGLGEAATLPTAPAIVNAIYHACGARVRQLPATPERVLAAIKKEMP